jgi:hypothetical protein
MNQKLEEILEDSKSELIKQRLSRSQKKLIDFIMAVDSNEEEGMRHNSRRRSIQRELHDSNMSGKVRSAPNGGEELAPSGSRRREGGKPSEANSSNLSQYKKFNGEEYKSKKALIKKLPRSWIR